MSAFLGDRTLSKVSREMSNLAKARGFDPNGSYTFKPNSNVNRRDGSIIGGTVNGTFHMNASELQNKITFERADFGDHAWRIVCTYFGFKYNVWSDIERITVTASDVQVQVSIPTPKDEVVY